MVRHVTNQTIELDHVFRALSASTRRAVVHQLSGGAASVSELAAPFAMALPSFLQHLNVLEDSQLVRSTKAGRTRVYELAPAPLHTAEHWLGAQRAIWHRRLDQLDRYLLDLMKEK